MILRAALLVLFFPSLARADAAAPSPAGGLLQRQALELLSGWSAAQNRGDTLAYVGFYDALHFKGVKRTARGGVKRFDFVNWVADRSKMLQRHPRIEVASPSVETWLDAKSTLKKGVIAVRFMQRWRSDHYADHGLKLLHLERGSAGQLQIIYEDLLSSEPGWDERAAVVAKLLLTPPASDEAAHETWRKIAPTGARLVSQLDAIPAQVAVTRPLARSILSEGRFHCEKVVRVSECGDEQVSWEELDAYAGIDDPCLRRRLALWALTHGQLREADVEQLSPKLLPLLSLPAPEDELPGALLALTDSMSTALRLRFLHAAPPTVAEQHLSGLPEAALAELYDRDHLDGAAEALDPARDRPLVLTALTDERLTVATRATLLRKLAAESGVAKDLTAALVTVADSAKDCGLAMDAAQALADRGNVSHLPRRSDAADEAGLARALCLLAHDGDSARQLARYKEFLPPRGRVTVSEQFENDFADRDADGQRVDESPPDEHFTRRELSSFNLDSQYGDQLPECGADGCKVPTSDGWFAVRFARAKDGRLYISELHRYRWRGCPC